MISLKSLKAIAEDNENVIAANLLPLLGYGDSEETRKTLTANGIRSGTNIIERRGADSYSTKVLSNQEAIYYALTIQSIENTDDSRRMDLQRALISAYEPYLGIKACQLGKNHMEDVEDLKQEGAIALYLAILDYDPDCSPFFAGYANPSIIFAMNKANYRQISQFKWNEDIEIKTLNLKAYADALGITKWDDKEVKEAAEKFKISEKRVRKYIGYFRCLEPMYVDTTADYDMSMHTADNGYESIHRQISYTYNTDSAEDEYFKETGSERVTVTLDTLPAREADIMKDYAGLNDDDPGLKGNITAISRKYGEKRQDMNKEIINIRRKLLKAAG